MFLCLRLCLRVLRGPQVVFYASHGLRCTSVDVKTSINGACVEQQHYSPPLCSKAVKLFLHSNNPNSSGRVCITYKTLVMYLKTSLDDASPSCPWNQLVGTIKTSTHLFITCLRKSLSARSDRDLNLAYVSLSLPVLALGADYHHISATAAGYFVALVDMQPNSFLYFRDTKNKHKQQDIYRSSSKDFQIYMRAAELQAVWGALSLKVSSAKMASGFLFICSSLSFF